MDETRDIAITSAASAKSAHHRLDAINGQIAKLGESHEKMRGDFNEALYDPEHGLHPELVALRTTLHNSLKVAGAIAAASVTVATGVAVYALTHPQHTSPAPSSQPRVAQQK